MNLPMIPLQGRALAQLDTIGCGRLVFCKADDKLEPALSVELPTSSPQKKLGLLLFRREYAPKQFSPQVTECGEEWVIDLGAPMIAMSPESDPSLPAPRFDPFLLSVRDNDLALRAKFYENVGRWSLRTGKPVESAQNEILVRHWSIGIEGIDGKYLSLVDFPHKS